MNKILATLGIVSLLISACGEGGEKSPKGKWSAKDKATYMKDCVSSAKKSFESRGQQGDSAMITKLCLCSGEMIEEKYAYTDAGKISQDEAKAVMTAAAQKCLQTP